MSAVIADCQCYNCSLTRPSRTNGFGGAFVGLSEVFDRMICCEHCGNKRCPHATYHGLACTNSNEPGQPGSRYTDEP